MFGYKQAQGMKLVPEVSLAGRYSSAYKNAI